MHAHSEEGLKLKHDGNIPPKSPLSGVLWHINYFRSFNAKSYIYHHYHHIISMDIPDPV